jgi:hypothetical protein
MTSEAHKYFNQWLESFDEAVTEAARVSRAASGRTGVSPKAWWASVLFTRMCTTSVSLLCLTPTSRFAGTLLDHYDSSATAALARNIIDSYLMFFYLCIDDGPAEEWQVRLKVMYLHDCMSRLKMFRDLNPEDPQVARFKEQADQLRVELMAIPFLAAYPEKKQMSLLKGDRSMIISRDDLLEKLDIDHARFRGIYALLSSHIHSAPLAFSRMADGDRGRGVESDYEKGRIGLALELADGYLRRATAEVLTIFPDARLATSLREQEL